MGNIDASCCTLRARDELEDLSRHTTPRCSARDPSSARERLLQLNEQQARLNEELARIQAGRCSGKDAARGSKVPPLKLPAVPQEATFETWTQGPLPRSAVDRVLADRTNILEAQGVFEKAPVLEEKHPSLGSVQHAAGLCKRCCFFPRGRCSNGYNCEFCHYEHEKRSRRKRRSKGGQGQAGLELDDLDDDDTATPDLQIQLPTTPESLAGDTGSWSNTPGYHTPEGAAVFVQSCLCTVPADTRQNTTAVPVYTATLWDEQQQQKAGPSHLWAAEGGDYIAWGAVHSPSRSGQNRLLPEENGFIVPETAPLSMHIWQDAPSNQWQSQQVGCEWPGQQAEWDFNNQSADQQAWEWNTQVEAGYTSAWGGCSLVEDQTMSWNPQSADSYMPHYMHAVDASRTDSAQIMPEYMSAIQPRKSAAEDTDGVSVTRGSLLSTTPQVLPRGVELVVDVEPPPLSPLKS